jgi:hypothetical protein
MGVEYERWLLPKSNVFMPGGAAVAKLVARLRAEKWIPDPASPDFARLRFQGKSEKYAAPTGGYAVRTVDNTFDDLAATIAASTESQPAALTGAWLDDGDREELRLVWPVRGPGASSLRYPLTHRPDGDVYYALEIHRAYDFVYPASETIDPVATKCPCGDDLSFEWDEEEVVPAFRSSTGIFAVCEACSRTFDPSKTAAKITNPFDGRTEEVFGGAAYRFALKVDCGKCFVSDGHLAFAPELVALVSDELGRDFREIGSVY